MEDRIEQRITIRAAQDKVWQIVTRPGWWLPGSDADPARGPGRVSVAYGGDARPYVIDIVRLEPHGYASFRWASAFGGAEPGAGHGHPGGVLPPAGRRRDGRDGGGERLRVA